MALYIAHFYAFVVYLMFHGPKQSNGLVQVIFLIEVIRIAKSTIQIAVHNLIFWEECALDLQCVFISLECGLEIFRVFHLHGIPVPYVSMSMRERS